MAFAAAVQMFGGPGRHQQVETVISAVKDARRLIEARCDSLARHASAYWVQIAWVSAKRSSVQPNFAQPDVQAVLKLFVWQFG